MPSSTNQLSAVERKIQQKNNNSSGTSVKRSKSFNSTSAPTSPSTFRRKKQPALEPRYNKSTYLLIEAKKLAKELEAKKKKGSLFAKPQSANTISLGSRSRSGSASAFSGIKRLRRPHTASETNSPRSNSPVIDGRLTPLRNSGRRRNFIAQSPGKTCDECDRTLKSGLYSEHHGLSYCNVPCYTSLFSSLYLRSDDVHSCSSLSQEQKELRSSLIPKLRTYNTYYADKPCQISCREINDKFVLEGVIKVYWGLEKPVTLVESDVSLYWKHFQPDDGACNHNTKENIENEPPLTNGKYGKPPLPLSAIKRAKGALQPAHARYNHKRKASGDGARKRTGCYACNYELNNTENTTSFIPPRGTPTTLRVTNHVTAPIVVDMLLKKFQIRDDRKRFTLFTVYESGGQKRLPSISYPLLTRLNLGPCEDVAKIFIMDSAGQSDIPLEVAQYINFSTQVLQTFINKFHEEEDREIERIKEKYDDYKNLLMDRLNELGKESRCS